MTYYCRSCDRELGLLENVYTSDPLQSEYQWGKFLKHTVAGVLPDSSVFNSTSTGRYAYYIVNTGASGAVEIDCRGRRNIVLLAGQPTGFEYRNGILVGPTDGVKMVLSSGPAKVHAFPVSAAALTTKPCARCGGPVAS